MRFGDPFMKQIAIISGKGGVGKSTISIMLALAISKNHKVLLLDFDLCGPSCTKALGAVGPIVKAERGLQPIEITDNLYLISMGSMISETDAVIWRGPKKLSILNLFYDSISDYDYVIIDTPPGISEEHGFLIGKDISAIVVTTSQNIALSDSIKAVEFCRRKNIEILGVIENMCGYSCKCCGEKNFVFASLGGRLLAEKYNLNFLCQIGIETTLSKAMDLGHLVSCFWDLSVTRVLEEEVIPRLTT